MDMDVIYPSSCRLEYRLGGFSLIELLVALAIASILLGLAAPSFSEIIQNNRLTGQLNHLTSQLLYARSEAVKSNRNVIVCKSTDGMNCTNASHWEDGWIVFADDDRDRQRDGSEALLAVQPLIEHDLSINYGAFPSDNYVLYKPDGSSLGNGTFTFCDNRGKDKARALVLYRTGRLRSARNMPDGSELRCPVD